MYLVFNGNDYTTYDHIFKVFHSFDKALDYATERVKDFSEVEYTSEYIKTKLKESYDGSERVFGISRGVFYYRGRYDTLKDSLIGIEYVRVGDMER